MHLNNYYFIIMEEFKDLVKKLNLDKTFKHIFICISPENSKCCNIDDAIESWEYLKKRTLEIQQQHNIIIQRSKVSCLRICQKWPIVVIYPEWVWYHSCNKKNLEMIIDSHVLSWIIVQDLLIFPPKN